MMMIRLPFSPRRRPPLIYKNKSLLFPSIQLLYHSLLLTCVLFSSRREQATKPLFKTTYPVSKLPNAGSVLSAASSNPPQQALAVIRSLPSSLACDTPPPPPFSAALLLAWADLPLTLTPILTDMSGIAATNQEIRENPSPMAVTSPSSGAELEKDIQKKMKLWGVIQAFNQG